MENYIGPHWSDGKWQESVEFGNAPALSEVDAASRLHDSAYAHFKDEAHRIAADEIYSKTLKKLKEKYAFLADVPLYGNYTKNRASEFGSNFVTGMKYGGLVGGLASLVYSGVKGIVRNNDLIQHGEKYRREVMQYYDTDPGKPKTAQNIINKIAPVTHPPPKAPLQNIETIQNNDMFKKNRTAPAPSDSVQPVKVPKNKVQPLYKPLKKKKRDVTAADLALYLRYHPGEEARVLKWIHDNVE